MADAGRWPHWAARLTKAHLSVLNHYGTVGRASPGADLGMRPRLMSLAAMGGLAADRRHEAIC